MKFIIEHIPSLSTMRQPYAALGSTAVELITAQIEKREILVPRIFLDAEMVIRQSVAPPRS